MSQTLQMLYDSTYESLLSYRAHLIQELERISNQISNLKREAKGEGVTICEPAQRKGLIDQNNS